MVEDNAAESVINAVIDVVTRLAVANSFADDRSDGCRSSCHEEPSGLGEDLDFLGKKAIDFSVYFLRQRAEWFDVLVVRGGKATADVENLDFVSATLGFVHHCRGNVERLDKVLEIRALTADMEAQAFDN